MSDFPAETKPPPKLGGWMEPLPISAPPSNANSGSAQTFQSSLYFGSPGSPSQNPFSFAVPTAPATTASVTQAVKAPAVQPPHVSWPPSGFQNFKPSPDAPSAMDSLQGPFVTEQPRDELAQPSFLPTPVPTPVSLPTQPQHAAEVPLSHVTATHGDTPSVAAGHHSTWMQEHRSLLPQTVENFSAQNGPAFQPKQHLVEAAITATDSQDSVPLPVLSGNEEETTPLLNFTPSSSQEAVAQQLPNVDQLEGSMQTVFGMNSDAQSTEQPLLNLKPEETEEDVVTSSIQQPSSLPVHSRDGSHSNTLSPEENPSSLHFYPSGRSSPLQPDLPHSSRSSSIEGLPPPPPPPPLGSRASSTLSTGSSTPRQPLLPSHQSLGPQSVPETLMGVNTALTQQLTNAFTLHPNLSYQHSYTNANIPPKVGFSQGFPLQEHSWVSEGLQAMIQPMAREIKPLGLTALSHLGQEDEGMAEETNRAPANVDATPLVEQRSSGELPGTSEGSSQPASSPTQSVSSLLDGTDENIALHSPFKLVPPAETSLPHPFASDPSSEPAIKGQTEQSTASTGSGEGARSTDHRHPLTVETLPPVTSFVAHSSDAQGQTPPLLSSQLHNGYSPPISHPGERQESASLHLATAPAAITTTASSSQIPPPPDQLGTSRPPELAAPEGSAEPVLDLQLGQPSTAQLLTGAPPPPPPPPQSLPPHMSDIVSAPPMSSSHPNVSSLPDQLQPRPHTTADGKDCSHSPPPAFPVGAVSLPSDPSALTSTAGNPLIFNPLSIQKGSHPSAFSPPPLTKTDAGLPPVQSTVPPESLPKSSTATQPSSLPSSGPANNLSAVSPTPPSSFQPTSTGPPLPPPPQSHPDVSEQAGYQDRRPAGMESEGQGYGRPGYYPDDDTYDNRHYHRSSGYHERGERYPADYYEYHQSAYPYDDHRSYYPRRQPVYDPYDDRRPYFPQNRPEYDPHDNRRPYYPQDRPVYDPHYDYRGGREPYHYQSYHHDPYYDQRGYYHGGPRGQRSDRHYYDWQGHGRLDYYDERDRGYRSEQHWEEQDYHRQENVSWYPEDQHGAYAYGDHHHYPASQDQQYGSSEAREDISLADTSAIHGRPDQVLDPTQSYYNSPSVAYSQPVGHGYDTEPPYESTRLDQPGPADYGSYPYPADERGYGQSDMGQPEGAYMYDGEVEEPWRPIAEGNIHVHVRYHISSLQYQ